MGALNVSRETIEKLEMLHELLLKWNPKINLVSRSTLKDAWQRHIADSIQVFEAVDHPVPHWLDIGSGGGFPGLVIALMQGEENAPNTISLIESDQRKCAFLRSVLRETGAKGNILAQRIEQAPPQNAQVISARALADLDLLFSLPKGIWRPVGSACSPKAPIGKKKLRTHRKHGLSNMRPLKVRQTPMQSF